MQINIEKIRKEKPIQELIKFSIINVDKPTGPTSFSIDTYIKRALGLTKTSHFGTLDPMVTGVLPIALGRACRLNEYFMHRNKTYVGIMRLHEEVPIEKLKEEIKKFIGKITQLPPVRSRVKRQERVREVIIWDILEVQGKDVLFKTEVQAGTYIRKLIHDLGLNIGGAHMLELRRTQAGIFSENSKEFPLTTLYDFDKALEEYKNHNDKPLRKILVPAEIVSMAIPVVQVKSGNLKQLLTGKPLFKTDIADKEEFSKVKDKFAVFFQEQFIGCYKLSSEGDIVGRPEFVFN
jgi:H/ACA ribonucleoprotein complex subunit 4